MKMKEYKHTWMMSKWLVLSLVQVVVLLMDIVTCEKAEKIKHEKKNRFVVGLSIKEQFMFSSDVVNQITVTYVMST